MSDRVAINVSVPKELGAFVQAQLQNERFANLEAAVVEGLQLLKDRDDDEREALLANREKLRRASEQADRGQFVDGDEAFAKARAIIEKHRQSEAHRGSKPAVA